MLIDVVNQYDEEKKEFLLDLRKKIVNQLIKKEDIKKIISFLNKCGIIGIDDKKKHIYLGVPNEFVATQVKKFFNKKLNETISEIFNPQFKIKIQIFPPFQSGRHPLQLNLIKFLKIKKSENKKLNLDKQTKEKLSEFFGILFDKRFKFSNFVVGSNNKLAFIAAKKVAENPGKVYNPLFIWGNVGLGKTHLLQAIGNYIIEHFPEKVVIYFPTTKFIDEIVEAIRKNKLNFLIEKLNQIDVLILDDIQFLGQKEKTQEIFHNIFNELYSKNKQIVLSSDQPPKMLNLLEKRLTSRFAMGLVVDIQKPDFETRLAILLEKLKEKGEKLDKEILNLIAETVTDNIRELEGALNVIITRKNLLGEELDIEEVKKILKNLGYSISVVNQQVQNPVLVPSKKDLNYYLQIISQYYNLDPTEIKGNSRKKEISLARQMLMYIGKKYLNRTLERIGDFFGGKNHATVIYAINNFEKILKQDENVKQDFNRIIQN